MKFYLFVVFIKIITYDLNTMASMLLPIPSEAPLKTANKSADKLADKSANKPTDKPRYVMVEMLNGLQFPVKVLDNETYQQAADGWVEFNKKIMKRQFFAVSMFDNKYSIKEMKPNGNATQAGARTGNTSPNSNTAHAGARVGNTNKTLCKWGAKCHFNAKGTCTFSHSSEDESASTQDASASASD